MKLIQAKTRGTGPLIESGWFQLSGGLNRFFFENGHEGTLFLRSLQSLNPIFSPSRSDIFGKLPLFEKRGNYVRHIQAAKRTVSLGVFAANSTIVGELGELDNNLYETDRIEVGRRLDYSRWMNFVELSSSTRWKEVKESVRQLAPYIADDESRKEAENFIESLQDADRVKEEVSERLVHYLTSLNPEGKKLPDYPETIEKVLRADHFLKAREIVFDRLPLLIYFNSHGDIAPQRQNSLVPAYDHRELHQFAAGLGLTLAQSRSETKPERIERGAQLAINLSEILTRMKPIFIFDAPEKDATRAERDKLAQLLEATAASYQCLYLSRGEDIFSSTTPGKIYTDSELQALSKSRALV